MKYSKEIIHEIENIFSDIPFKDQNDFKISITYNYETECHHLLIYMKIYDGILKPNCQNESIMEPRPTIFEKTAIIPERFNPYQGERVGQYLYDLKEFIYTTKEKFREELKRDIPYGEIKLKIELDN